MHITKIINEVDYQAGQMEPTVTMETEYPLVPNIGDEIVDRGVKYIVRRVVRKITNKIEEICYSCDVI